MYKISQHFPALYKHAEVNMNVKLDSSNYETKTDLKNTAVVDISNVAVKSDLASLKTDVDKRKGVCWWI